MRFMKSLACAVAAAVLAGVPATAAEAAPEGGKRSALRKVLVVSNNWDGTATLVDARTFKARGSFDVVPDRDARMAEVMTNPVRLGFFLGIRHAVGEGHDQFVDDGFTSPDGRVVYFSRPSFADVVAISLKTKEIVWRTPVEGQRSDHMDISHDGRHLLVSASTARKVHVIDTASGRIVANFPSGDTPHENVYSKDGRRIYHASIGTVYTPLDEPAFATTKGDRWFEIVDARTYEVLKTFDMGEELREAGYPDMSSAVRPMTFAPKERYVYFQVSFFHGFVEFDLKEGRVRRVASLPISKEAQEMHRSEYVLDSAHHGIVMSRDGRKLCVAGTMSDYGAIVDRRTLDHRIAARGSKPYWATNAPDGKHCVMSFSGDDRVALISYRTGEQVDSVAVGDHPQRIRQGVVRRAYLR